MDKFEEIKNICNNTTNLLVVTKKRTKDEIMHYYDLGQRAFGENKAQELLTKIDLPQDIQWHFIGHLQRNKVSSVLPYVELIHSVDNEALIKVIQKEAEKVNKIQNILLELKLTKDENKTGLSKEDLPSILNTINEYPNIRLKGFMCMGPNTDNIIEIDKVFKEAFSIYTKYKNEFNLDTLSMGMSNDYLIAIKNGSTLIRIGTILF